MNEIKELRKKYGLSQKKLGEMYHIPWRTIQNWEAEEGANARSAPRYVVELLKRCLEEDFEEK